MRVSVDVFCAIHDCALGDSPVTSYSGEKNEMTMTPCASWGVMFPRPPCALPAVVWQQ